MNNRESRSESNAGGGALLVLIAFTVTAIILLAEIFVRDWERIAVPVVVAAIVYAWYLSVMQKFSESYRLLFYTGSMMVCYFFYGIHQTSLDELSVSILVIILVFLVVKHRGIIWMTVFAYYFTIFFNLAKAGESWREIYNISGLQLTFQLVLVGLAGAVSHFIVTKLKNERVSYAGKMAEIESQKEFAREQTRIVAKELNNLADEMKGELLLLKKEMGDKYVDEKLPDEVSEIFSLGYKLEMELTDLKDFSDMLNDKTSIEPEVYELGDVLTRLKQNRKVFGDMGGPGLIFDVDPMLPKRMVGDREKILKILRHLIHNGIRYTKRGCVRVKIYGRFHGSNFNLCIEVSDTGMGIDQADLERMLEQLSNRRTADYRPGGLGFGLYLVSGFVRRMGGAFKIESEWGAGTDVCISIPQRVTDAAPWMSFDKRAGICVVHKEEDSKSVVSNYYEEMFRNLSEKLGIPGYNYKTEDDLLQLIGAYKKVCLFTEIEKYRSNREFYDKYKEIFLVVAGNRNDKLPERENIHLMRHPVGTPEILHAVELAANTIDRRQRDDDKCAIVSLENLSRREIRLHGGRKVLICTDSMSDIPPEISRNRGIPVIPFRVFTEHASFMDGVEMSQQCALSYFEENRGIHSMAPEEEEFKKFFENCLKYADHIIYVSTARRVSVAYDRAVKAAANMSSVTVFNSGQVSGGIALMAIMADEQAKMGKDYDEIVRYLENIRPKVKTSFLIDNLDHLTYVGKVSKGIGKMSRILTLHPIISMRHDAMKVSGAKFGNISNAKERYINRILRRKQKMDDERIFVGAVGFSNKELVGLNESIMAEGYFKEVIMRRSSAAISLNCGVGTFGIIYVEK
ncbi:MAG: DegV family EDD domain-containing protein [Lachnospiraceae bacterium]|nr:DegV family EDD domain-containing protein [Lachnospiraceae bacterium]